MIPKKEVIVKPKNFFKLYLIICFVKIYIKIVSWIVFDIKYEEMFIKVKTFALRKTLKKKNHISDTSIYLKLTLGVTSFTKKIKSD